MKTQKDIENIKSAFNERFKHNGSSEKLEKIFTKASKIDVAKRLKDPRWTVDNDGNAVISQAVHCVASCRLPIKEDGSDAYHKCINCFRMYVKVILPFI